jgi:hypothetical protein
MSENALRSPKEIQLDLALKSFAKAAARPHEIPQLPYFAELEPGSILHLVKSAWGGEEGRDGRKTGFLSENDIAQEIRKIIHRAYSRSQFQAMFGEGRMAGAYGNRSRQPVPRDVADAFLKVALRNWYVGPDGKRHAFRTSSYNLESAIESACTAMYARDEPVLCIPSPGQGVFGLYAECGNDGASIIAATHNAPVIMHAPEKQVLEWLTLMRSLFNPESRTTEIRESQPIHVWAVPEPWISQKHGSMRAMVGIANLRSVFWIVDNLMRAEPDGSGDRDLWDIVKHRGVIAIKTNPKNQPQPRLIAIPRKSSIDEDHIFPSEVPEAWFRAGVPNEAEKLNSLARIGHKGEDRVGYYVFDEYKEPISVRARPMPSPGASYDSSFKNLHSASLQFVDRITGQDLLLARQEGWAFKRVDEFLKLTLPTLETIPSTGSMKSESA